MTFLNKPIKSLEAVVTDVVGYQSMQWNSPMNYPVIPGSPLAVQQQKDFKWRVHITVNTQYHSSYLTRNPGLYNGLDVTIGQWIANTVTGQSWQITSIESKSDTNIVAIVQDIYRYNTNKDSTQDGNGSPNLGNYIIFSVLESGVPLIDPVPASGISSSFTNNLQSRFEYINLQHDYPLYQENNNFQYKDVISVDSTTNSFVKSALDNKLVIGRVTSISDTMPGWFTINPVQKIVDFLDYLPGDIGDIIYTSTSIPGEITTIPGGAQLYIKLRNNTSSISVSTLAGPTTPGNIFQLNGVDVTVGGSGTANNVISAVNSLVAQTGVSASSILQPSVVQTNNSLITNIYGEPALWASSLPATATINGILVIFNITSTDPGYEDYSRPAQMAQAINNASIPNIVASSPSALVLRITNTAGGSITIVNGTSDINGVPFAGTNSGSGFVLSTPASTNSIIEFTAIDARSINFLDVVGATVSDFGLISVENGIKACGLYIKQGLRESITTVVTNLTQLNTLSPMVGDQAYVIDSDDGQGNNVGEWSMWIYNGSSWTKTTNQGSAETDAKSLEAFVTSSTPSTQIIGEISTRRRVTLITVEVIVPFDTPAALSVGYLINNPTPQSPEPEGLMAAGLIDLTLAGTYITSTDVLFGTDTVQGDISVMAFFTGNGSTQGTARIILSYV